MVTGDKEVAVTDNKRPFGTEQEKSISFTCLIITAETCCCIETVDMHLYSISLWKPGNDKWCKWAKRFSKTTVLGSKLSETGLSAVFLQYLGQRVCVYVLW